MYQWIESALVIGDKPFSKPLLSYCEMDFRNKLRWDSNQNTNLFVHENIFKNAFCKMAVLMSRGRWVNFVVMGSFKYHRCVLKSSFISHCCLVSAQFNCSNTCHIHPWMQYADITLMIPVEYRKNNLRAVYELTRLIISRLSRHHGHLMNKPLDLFLISID